MLVDQFLAKRINILRLIAVKPDGLDIVADCLFAQRKHLLGRWRHLKQGFSGFVNTHIGRLCA